MAKKRYDPAEKFNYSYDGRVMIITGTAERDAAELRIPPEIDGHPVTVIGNGAFQYCHGLRYVAVPDTVRVIENAAFRGCESLVTADLSLELSALGSLAFQGCESLRSLTVSDHTDRIEVNSFKGCRSLETVRVKLSKRADTDEIKGEEWGVRIAGYMDDPFRRDSIILKHPKYGLIRRTEDCDIRSFAVASETDEAIWLYMRAVMRAADPRGGSMDKYDATFLELRSEDDMYRVASQRLSDPYNMPRKVYKIYRDSLTGMINSVISQDRVDRLTMLGGLGCLEKELLADYIERAGRVGGGCIAYLLEYQNRYAQAGAYDYSL